MTPRWWRSRTKRARKPGNIGADTYVITLEICGKMLSSEQLAAKLDELATYGKSKIAFVIGGSLGISESVQKRSELVLVEQVYRSYRIIRNEPYHK